MAWLMNQSALCILARSGQPRTCANIETAKLDAPIFDGWSSSSPFKLLFWVSPNTEIIASLWHPWTMVSWWKAKKLLEMWGLFALWRQHVVALQCAHAKGPEPLPGVTKFTQHSRKQICDCQSWLGKGEIWVPGPRRAQLACHAAPSAPEAFWRRWILKDICAHCPNKCGQIMINDVLWCIQLQPFVAIDTLSHVPSLHTKQKPK